MPTVFMELPRLLERAWPGTEQRTITGIFSVLVDGDDHNEPVADAVRGILDGGHRYPEIIFPHDGRAGRSRLPGRHQPRTPGDGHVIGYGGLAAFRSGSVAEVDEAIAFHKPLGAFLAQSKETATTMAEGYQVGPHPSGPKKHKTNLIAAQSVRNGSPRGSGPGTLARQGNAFEGFGEYLVDEVT
jgi:flagellum-specific ATP synthase